MQLKSLEIFGFKSFAERTKLVFDEGITGIVGPNGCGKSNIVDSIRWVLGEQKTRNLRSDKMENVIFNGTKHKRKSNVAEVSLTFDNTKNILPTEYTTVTITRKLYRSGESEYMINGVICRLKDIHGLFMDTGVSSESYAIIELKMVDEILTNKNNERRAFFEEAAGISKYKVRKRQTLRRLKETDEDLERVEDLLFEIEKNLKSLEKQARRTQRYFELKEEYKIISSQYAYLSVKSIREKEQQIGILVQDYQDQVRGIQAETAQKEARMQALRTELVGDEKNLSEAQYDLNQHLRKIQSMETEKSIKNERLKYLQQREIAIQNQLGTERQQMSRNESQVMDLKNQQADLEGKLTAQERETKDLFDQLSAIRDQYNYQQEEAEVLSNRLRTLEQETQDLIREDEVKRVQIESLTSEISRAEEDRSQRSEDLDAFSSKSQELEGEVSSLGKQVAELEAKEDQRLKSLKEAEELVTKTKDSVYRSNRLLDAKQNEFDLTKSLVENLEGFPESVKFLKKNAQWMHQAPLLSDILACPDEFRVAFENYLEPYLSYYIVKSRQDAILAIHMLADAAKGRANFFILDELESYKARTPLLFTQAKAALEVVEFAEEYKKLAAFLLDNVYLVSQEKDFPEDVPSETVFLTRAGNMAKRKFVMSGGSLGLFEGKRLGRAKNLEKLQKEIGKLQKQLTSEKVKLDKATSELEALKRGEFRKTLQPLQQSLVEKERDLSVLQSREKEHREFLARVGQRTESLVTELEALKKSVSEIEPTLKVKREEHQMLAVETEEKKQLAQEMGLQVTVRNEQYNQSNIQLIQLRNQFDNFGREISSKQDQILRFSKNSEKLQEEKAQMIADTEEIIQSNLQDDESILVLYKQKKELESRVDRLEQKVGMTKSSIHQVDEGMGEIRRKRDSILEKLRTIESSQTETKIEINSLRERMSVEFKIDIQDLQAEELFDKEIESYDFTKIEEKLLKLRGRVQNFGDINPLAVEAFNEIKERHDFISGQRQDLIEAKESLLQTIAEIDEKAQAKFLETYIEVRENFQKVFRSLFSEDDSCDLILKDSENPLESDISIVARPKGKRPLTISQLSGGEKTLTAVALLFSIYLIKPAPFCIFDEVDAPLDDANIDKFINIIKDFSSGSQFIIVTHNKRTMNATKVMYGVTMREGHGVSTIAPVNLEALNLN